MDKVQSPSNFECYSYRQNPVESTEFTFQQRKEISQSSGGYCLKKEFSQWRKLKLTHLLVSRQGHLLRFEVQEIELAGLRGMKEILLKFPSLHTLLECLLCANDCIQKLAKERQDLRLSQ